MYYKLIGRLPVPCDDFTEAWTISENMRRVGGDMIGPLWVSTVFLVLDHGMFNDEGPPLLFETMILGDDIDGYQTRCTTWEEAEAMHRKAVQVATEVLRKAEAVTGDFFVRKWEE
jgi:hypothetical protein